MCILVAGNSKLLKKVKATPIQNIFQTPNFMIIKPLVWSMHCSDERRTIYKKKHFYRPQKGYFLENAKPTQQLLA